MGEFADGTFERNTIPTEILARNLYEALVLEGGPSGQAEDRIDAAKLEIPLGQLEHFAQKRLITLEAMLFVAAHMETLEHSEDLQQKLGDGSLHPLAEDIGKLIVQKWRDRGIDISNEKAANRCIDEVEEFLTTPLSWGKSWLEEFYDDHEKPREHSLLWVEQWRKEFTVLRHMISKST